MYNIKEKGINLQLRSTHNYKEFRVNFKEATRQANQIYWRLNWRFEKNCAGILCKHPLLNYSLINSSMIPVYNITNVDLSTIDIEEVTLVECERLTFVEK
jgi:hypothetical protein